MSDFCCINCDRKWEEHETTVELESERAAGGREIGANFLPMSDNREI